MATSHDDQIVDLFISSTCPNIRRLSDRLSSIDAFVALGAGFDNAIYAAARQTMPSGCSGCIVLAGVYKAMQSAAGLALPVDAQIAFQVEA